MLIQCTDSLASALSIKDKYITDEPNLMTWHAHLTKIKGKDTILVMNDLTLFTLVLYDISLSDSNSLSLDIICRIRDQADLDEKFWNHERILIKYFLDLTLGHYSNSNRSNLKNEIKKMAINLENYAKDLENPTSDELSYYLNTNFVITYKGATMNPLHRMYCEVLSIYDIRKPTTMGKAVKLDVTLNIEDEAGRTVVVPYDMTFSDLHKIIKELFNYQKDYKHQFMIFEEEAIDFLEDPEDYDETVKLNDFLLLELNSDNMSVCQDVDENNDENIVKLGSIVEKYTEDAVIRYRYDGVDQWWHTIEIDHVYDSFDLSDEPSCCDGYGFSPAEIPGVVEIYSNIINYLRITGVNIHSDSFKAFVKLLESFGFEHYDEFRLEDRFELWRENNKTSNISEDVN